MFQVLTSGNYNTEQVRKTVIGLARDLRGIAFAFNTKVSMRYYDESESAMNLVRKLGGLSVLDSGSDCQLLSFLSLINKSNHFFFCNLSLKI